MTSFKKLLEPIKLGSLELPNRMIMAPMGTNMDYHDPSGDTVAAYYAERARGGVALVTTSSLQTIYPGRRERRGNVHLDTDASIPFYRKVTKAIHDAGGRASALLATYNYWAKNGIESTAEDIGPSAVEMPAEGVLPRVANADFHPQVRALTVEEIGMIVDQVGESAVRACQAGFDAVELQVVGTHLFNRFVNPVFNRRTDRYGGSVENRARIITETIANIKKKLGHDFPLLCRIAGADLMPWGLTIEDWKLIAPLFEKAGVHSISIYAGWSEGKQPRLQMYVPQGTFVYLAEGIKKVVKIPVATNMQLQDPVLCEQVLEEGKADLIVWGRPLLADPELPNKLKEGRLDDVRKCVACLCCNDNIAKGTPVSCTINAHLGREATLSIVPAKTSRRVFVIGGGPAGMEAARVAALRGHRVTLFERSGQLGGQLLYAALPPCKNWWDSFTQYLTGQMKKLNVEVRLGRECTAQTIAADMPDAVIIATGAEPLIPDVPGINGPNVVQALDVLSGKKDVNGRIVIIGGGEVGCETADFLAQKGRQTTILEMLPRAGADMIEANRQVLVGRLNAAKVRVETGAKVERITERGLWVSRPGTFAEFFEADSIILAAGMKPVNSLYGTLKGKVETLYQIGDCAKARKIKDAVEEGFLTGLKV